MDICVINELAEHMDIVNALIPCGATLEEAITDCTSIFDDAPRAILMSSFQEKIVLLLSLKHEGKLIPGPLKYKPPKKEKP